MVSNDWKSNDDNVLVNEMMIINSMIVVKMMKNVKWW